MRYTSFSIGGRSYLLVRNTGGVRFAVNSPPFAEPAALVDLAVVAERAGWDAFFLWDHMVVNRAGVEIVDPWVTLGAIAARTERIRLGTCVTPLARRRPEKVARETVTLDRLSGGRLVLGVGLGTPDLDLTTFGDPGDARVVADRLDEALAVVAGLWTGESFAHVGRDFRVERVRFLPRPVQQPRPPVWVACMLPARRPLARAARWDGVVPMKTGPGGVGFVNPDDVASIVAEIGSRRGSLEGFDVVVNAGPPPTASLAEFEAAGATWYITSMGEFPGWLDELRGIVAGGPPR
jgi:alkanesulfonate monooxygenase SsuD/methylene tetrahydromethanopterin reductase-like flavin-dependent oxidoreductase (luciferase family)